ncbi:unnamed protein product [Paramecium primaurelia]|uniref:non-specific serine/threonine protein kinase n=1 Tax=Paramecium primaurelia TaxID=5886 RepID=A0A8S1K0I7_PARPR|nr:unnamed protein product [Paramecium primaurelia]
MSVNLNINGKQVNCKPTETFGDLFDEHVNSGKFQDKVWKINGQIKSNILKNTKLNQFIQGNETIQCLDKQQANQFPNQIGQSGPIMAPQPQSPFIPVAQPTPSFISTQQPSSPFQQQQQMQNQPQPVLNQQQPQFPSKTGPTNVQIAPLQQFNKPNISEQLQKQANQVIINKPNIKRQQIDDRSASLPKKDNNELSPSSQSSSNNLEIVQQDEINHKADFDRVVQKLKKAFSILKILKILYKLQFRFWICKYKGRKENINIRNRVKIFSIYQAIGTRSFWMSIFGEKKTSGDLYAMKIIVWAQKQLETKLDTLKAERNSLEILSGEFVVKAYFSFSHEQYLCFVQEYIIGGDFSHILKMYTALDEEYVRHQIAEIVLALEYLRSKKNCTQRFKT